MPLCILKADDIGGNELSWFACYLSNIFQSSNGRPNKSSAYLIKLEFHKGSVLSLLWFLLYLGDLSTISSR